MMPTYLDLVLSFVLFVHSIHLAKEKKKKRIVKKKDDGGEKKVQFFRRASPCAESLGSAQVPS